MKPCLWGAALSAGQSEGGFSTRGTAISDTQPMEKGRAFKRYPSPSLDKYYPTQKGVEFYENFKEDIALMAEVGIQCLRTSFSWVRLFPTGMEKEASKEGLAFYDEVINLLIENHIEPIITISHLEIPYYLFETYGGWEHPAFVDSYVRLAKSVITHFKGRVKYWITFNEMNVALHLPLSIGVGVDRSERPLECKYKALHNTFLASAQAISFCHEVDPNAKIGAMVAYTPMYPKTCKPEDVEKAKQIEWENLMVSDVLAMGVYPPYAKRLFKKEHINIDMESSLLRENTVDFLATSYYCSGAASVEKLPTTGGNLFGGVVNPYLKQTEWGWQIDPIGIKLCLEELYDRYRIPLMITENGIGARDIVEEEKIHDPYRIAYLQAHVDMVQECIDEGIPLLAYTMWSFLDQVSASSGQMSKRYGLVYVDYDDEGKGSGKRLRKDSFAWYKDLIQSK